jgi:MSHA biogenesis protein MshL
MASGIKAQLQETYMNKNTLQIDEKYAADNRCAQAAASLLSILVLAGCAGTPLLPSDLHLGRTAKVAVDSRPTTTAALSENIPQPVIGTPDIPRPRQGPKLETYSVVVSQVEITELLFAMARDAKLNVDVHPGLKGKVTINAINQTLPAILNRLAKQVDLTYEFDGKQLVVMPDLPFVRHYTVDYVNMSRDSRANTSIATQISSAGRDPLSGGSGGSTQLNNNSTTQITNTSNNRFWETLVTNLRSLVGDAPTNTNSQVSVQTSNQPANQASGQASPSASQNGSQSGLQNSPQNSTANSGSATASVSANPETSLVSVRGSSRQHERVRDYLDKVLNSARRQVMIEATIAEVQLSNQFQQGINWSRMRTDGTGFSFAIQPQGSAPLGTGVAPGTGPGGITFPGSISTTNLPGGASLGSGQTSSLGVFRYLNNTSSLGNLGAAVSLLQSFGKVKVLSSPKISVLNNQTAVLKVVDNKVYFTIGVQITPGTATTAPLVTYTSTPNTVPVGFVMSVTAQIEDSGNVTMSVRPTISRIIGYVNDPNPSLAQSNVTSRIPEIQTRELESILKVSSGDIAVMGGLMQESVDDRQDSVPGASGLPFFGNLFKYKNESAAKSELVIFLRPIVVKDASIEGDYRGLKESMPRADFFNTPDNPSIPRSWMRNEVPLSIINSEAKK